MKYQAGDKVRVRSDLDSNKTYGGCFPFGDMTSFFGKVVTIRSRHHTCYFIEEGAGCNEASNAWWTDEMFEGLAEETDPAPEPQATDWFEDLF